MAEHPQRVGIVGGGILGLAFARELQLRRPGIEVVVFEKEAALATHQTGRNSGVVHAGLYYTPGSLKARLCVDGVRRLRAYCADRGIAYDECGKVVVALEPWEEPLLRGIHERALANGVPGVRLIDGAQIRELEPHAVGRLALHSPHTAIVYYAEVARAFADDVRAADGEIRLGHEVRGIRHRGGRVEVGTTRGRYTVDRLLTCAGLHSDRLAALAGDEPDPRIVPFRGEYYRLVPERRDLVRGLIYPVPDPRYPFLGVHLTKRIDGEVLVGPNAVLAFAREGYHFAALRRRDLLETLRYSGFRRLAAQHWRTGLDEMRRSLSRRRFVAEARRYVPELRDDDVVPAHAGVRAQALDADGALVDDFRITGDEAVVHVRNAPSPAATSSMAIADHLVDRLFGP